MTKLEEFVNSLTGEELAAMDLLLEEGWDTPAVSDRQRGLLEKRIEEAVGK